METLICVGCLVLLFVIAIPWMLSLRGTARDNLCLARSKAIAEGIIFYTDANARQLPYLVEEDIGWPVAVSPFMDIPGAVRDKKLLPAEELQALDVPQFGCPDDPRTSAQQGALSYVANAGFGLFPVDPETGAVSETGTHSAEIDLNGDGEVSGREFSVNYATGVVWRPDPREGAEGFRMSLPYISNRDGTEFTLLLTENLNAGNWLSQETMDLGFVIGRGRLTFAEGPDSRGSLHLRETDLGPFALNANAGTLPGRCPAPSSLHGGYVNAMYCDGRGGPLSSNIDPLAYARLMTSGGSQYGGSSEAVRPPAKNRPAP